MSLPRRLALHLRDNGPFWTLPAIAGALARRLRSLYASSVLGAPGLSLGPGCELLGVRHVRWGRDVSIRSRLWLEAVTRYGTQEFHPLIVIGHRTSFSDGVHITAIDRVEIGEDVLFGSHVFIGDHQHGSYGDTLASDPGEPPSVRPLRPRGPVIIEDRVWVGDGVHILGPCRIGAGAVIGAHAMVRGDVLPNTMVAGAPARAIKVFDEASGRWLATPGAGRDDRGPAVFAAEPRGNSSPS